MSDSPSKPMSATYDRPHAIWVCGRACEGRACGLGPSPAGKCSQTEGRCHPVRSLFCKRRVFAIGCTVLTIGLLLLIMASNFWNETIAPGSLTFKHSQILNREQTSNRCAACHSGADQSFPERLVTFVSGKEPPMESQATLCLKCHDKSIPVEFSRLGHTVSPAFLGKESATGEMTCSNCHREHHGTQHQLAALTNQQCHTCHTNKFASFAHGHPEFSQWPRKQRSPIAFDHGVHQAKYFPAGNRAFRCDTCHRDDSRQDVKLLADYRTACASCHDEKIQRSSESGWAFFALPRINAELLEKHDLPIGEWPEQASVDFDGTIPPLMKMLLATDPRGQAALERLGLDFDLSFVKTEDSEQLAAVAQLVWATKYLLYEFVTEGLPALQRRLETSQKRKFTREELAQLSGQVPSEVWEATAQTWLPNLRNEVPQHRDGTFRSERISRRTEEKPAPEPSPPALVSPEPPDERPLLPNPLRPARGDTFLPKKVTRGYGVRWLDHVAAPRDSLGPFRLVSGEMDDDELLLPATPTPLMTSTDDDDSLLTTPLSSDAPVEEKSAPAQVTDKFLSGGWSRDELSFTVTYRPTGHADRTLQAWIDLAAAIPSSSNSPLDQLLRTSVLRVTNAGRCTECHSLDNSPLGGQNVYWQSFRRDLQGKTLTKFSHHPHLTQPQLRDCSHCHQLDPNARVMASYITSAAMPNATNDHPFISNFLPITKSQCTSCHIPTAASDNCLKCHNYHVLSQAKHISGK